MAKPTKAILRAFNVGFGDCFLLSFVYSKTDSRNVLIDFGSTRPPVGAKSDHMETIARKIKELTGGKLHLVVATHRHKDHISGFATNVGGKASGNIIRDCKPDVVLQPWTEAPDIAEKATGPAFVANALRNMSVVSQQVFNFASKISDRQLQASGFSLRERDYLRFAGENNISNKSAVMNLIKMGKLKPKYLFAQAPLDLSKLLPGVTIDVLGPPTVKQHAEVAKQNPKNAEEYWHLAATNASTPAPGSKAKFPRYVVKPTTYGKWMKQRLDKMQRESLLSIVTALDDAMNNTSLILLFRCGGKSLLFPGDAQWENWQYALSQKKTVNLLKRVDVYKVGHHGSLNATPKSLWGLFSKKSTKHSGHGRLVSVMSTLHGVHGHSPATAVPRETLVDELEHNSEHHSTESVPLTKLYDEIEVPL